MRETSGELNSLLVEDIQGNRLITLSLFGIGRFKGLKQLGWSCKSAPSGLYRWSIQGPSASFTSSLGILAVVGMGRTLQNDRPSQPVNSSPFVYANMFMSRCYQLVSINNLRLVASGDESLKFLTNPFESLTQPRRLLFEVDLPLNFSPFRFPMEVGVIS